MKCAVKGAVKCAVAVAAAVAAAMKCAMKCAVESAVKCAGQATDMYGSSEMRRVGVGRFGSAFGSCPTGEGASRCGTAFLRGEQGDVAKGCPGIVVVSCWQWRVRSSMFAVV